MTLTTPFKNQYIFVPVNTISIHLNMAKMSKITTVFAELFRKCKIL